MTEISKIAGQLAQFDLTGIGRTSAPADGSFKKVLGGFLNEVNDLQLNMDQTIKKFAAGEVKDVHEVMVAAEEADIAFQLMMKIRGKLLKAYDEVMKMQV